LKQKEVLRRPNHQAAKHEKPETDYFTIDVNLYKSVGLPNVPAVLADLKTAEYEYRIDVVCDHVYGRDDSPGVIQPPTFCGIPDKRDADPYEWVDIELSKWDGVS